MKTYEKTKRQDKPRRPEELDDPASLQGWLVRKDTIAVWYILGTALLIVGAAGAVIWSLAQELMWTAAVVVMWGLIGLVMWRFICEVWMLLHGMHQRLAGIERSLKHADPVRNAQEPDTDAA